MEASLEDLGYDFQGHSQAVSINLDGFWPSLQKDAQSVSVPSARTC